MKKPMVEEKCTMKMACCIMTVIGLMGEQKAMGSFTPKTAHGGTRAGLKITKQRAEEDVSMKMAHGMRENG